MAKAKPIDANPWRTKLARPVRGVHRAAFWTFIVTIGLLVAGVTWLLWGLLAGTLQLALWQQMLIVLGLIGLISVAGLAFRVAFFARILRGFLD